jgi:hypothetical protein
VGSGSIPTRKTGVTNEHIRHDRSNAKTAERTEPTISWFERGAPISGIVFVVLMVVGSMLVGDVPAPDAPAREIAAYLSDSGTHTRNIIGAYLWVVGALAFLWFLVRLRNDIRKAEGGAGSLSTLAFAAGVAFAAVWMVSAAAYAALPMPSSCATHPSPTSSS